MVVLQLKKVTQRLFQYPGITKSHLTAEARGRQQKDPGFDQEHNAHHELDWVVSGEPLARALTPDSSL